MKKGRRNKEQERLYYEENRERIRDAHKAYYAQNKAKIKTRVKIYAAVNKDKILERKRAYYAANKERIKARIRAYQQANKDKRQLRTNAREKARRALKNNPENVSAHIVMIQPKMQECLRLHVKALNLPCGDRPECFMPRCDKCPKNKKEPPSLTDMLF